MQSIAILGRQPSLGIAELEQLFGSDAVRHFSPSAAVVEDTSLSVERLGGSIKVGRVVLRFKASSWNEAARTISRHYITEWSKLNHKQTLGISVYDWPINKKDIQKLGLSIKSDLKRRGVSLRHIPNTELAHNSAVSHHNKLGLSANKVELLICRDHLGTVIVAESTGAQNISALAARDQARPKTDAFVGMLPPKLALMMINMSGLTKKHARILDPFCGTGVVLQEAALIGHSAYGTDLSEKMIDYSTVNLQWLKEKYRLDTDVHLEQADATDASWQPPIDAVVAETYLGQPFSAPPSTEKLTQVRGNCNEIIKKFLVNLSTQLESGTPLCLAIPAWRDASGATTHLPLLRELAALGYTEQKLSRVHNGELLYFREDQIVARQLLLLKRS